MLMLALACATFQASALYDVTVTDKLRVWAEFPETIIADGETVNYIKVYEHDDEDVFYTAFNMEFILPEGFRVNQVRQGRLMVDDIFFSERATTTHSISCNIVDGVDLRIIGDSSMNADLFNDDEEGNLLDELFTIGLIAERSIPTGNYDVIMEGIKFCLSNADARVPADNHVVYNVYIKNDSQPDGVQEISPDMLDPQDCFDLQGRKVDPRVVHDTIVVSKGNKYYLR